MKVKQEFETDWSLACDSLSSQLPLWPAECVEELGLSIAALESLTTHSDCSQLASRLQQHGEVIAQFVLAFRQEHPRLCQMFADLSAEHPGTPRDPFAILQQLTALTRGQKKHGVFYTPAPVANYVTRTALGQLQAAGKKIDEMKILEPAVGCGIFPCELVAVLAEELASLAVIPQVLENLTCVDLSPAAIVIAQAMILSTLEHVGVNLPSNFRFRFLAANTLTCDPDPIYTQIEGGITKPVLGEILRTEKFQLVFGNPPFNSLTGKTDPWIRQLLHGQVPAAGLVDSTATSPALPKRTQEGKQKRDPSANPSARERSYFEAEGQPINERKTWLHDDYVKFLRYAQWQAERNSCGAIGLVLNSGFISNATFRGMRFQLLDALPQLQIVDFGGDQRNYRCADDENIFEIETGIATLVGTTQPAKSTDSEPELIKLIGNRQSKHVWCQTANPDASLKVERHDLRRNCLAPWFRFDRRPSTVQRSFEAGICLTELFKKRCSAPVTARDHLVIDYTRDKLIRKIESFLDPHLSDADIRARFFPKPRSRRYPAGDTRSWDLSAARKLLRGQPWQDWIIPCAYRPFDQRFILWHPAMIDWPRDELMTPLRNLPENYCLIARKQAPAGVKYNYIWNSNLIPLDGIVRNDNRGNEYCFPLYLAGSDGRLDSNLSPDVESYLSHLWSPKHSNNPPLDSTEIFSLIFAILNSSEYRDYYAEELTYQFPRVFFPRQLETARQLSRYGHELLEVQSQPLASTRQEPITDPCRRPLIHEGVLKLSKQIQIPVDETTWNFRAGSHQVLYKFCASRLRDGHTEGLESAAVQVRDLIHRQLLVQDKIDLLIAQQGGFQKVFDSRGRIEP